MWLIIGIALALVLLAIITTISMYLAANNAPTYEEGVNVYTEIKRMEVTSDGELIEVELNF